jgi:hypothetical protein
MSNDYINLTHTHTRYWFSYKGQTHTKHQTWNASNNSHRRSKLVSHWAGLLEDVDLFFSIDDEPLQGIAVLITFDTSKLTSCRIYA